jgi:hypothetical protein
MVTFMVSKGKKMLGKLMLGLALVMGVVTTSLVPAPQAHAQRGGVVRLYGPYPTAAARNAAAGSSRSWAGGYLTRPPVDRPGIRHVGYRGPGYYFWYYV